MGIDQARYHGWTGPRQAPAWSCLAIVRVALLQLFRRKAYWLVLLMGCGQFLLIWSVIYAITQLNPPPRARDDMLQAFGFSVSTSDVQSSGYIIFMHRQSIVVMILLAFAGSLLVGSDFRQRTLPFYLSRRIDRRHYIVGKLLAVSAIVALMTVVPALLLFIEFGMFTSSTDYWIRQWRVPVAVLAYGGVLCATLSIWIVTLSAYLQKVAPIAITWCSLFMMLGRISEYLERQTDDIRWRLLDPWSNIRNVGRLCFGRFDRPEQRDLAVAAAMILIILCGLCLVALVRRVRAVEVVE
jgi:ABC-2 type transport system permease protein